MRRRTQLVLAITFMVTALVSAFSYIYISELLRQRVTTAHESAAQLTSNLAYLAANAAPDLSSTRVDTTKPEAIRRAPIECAIVRPAKFAKLPSVRKRAKRVDGGWSNTRIGSMHSAGAAASSMRKPLVLQTSKKLFGANFRDSG